MAELTKSETAKRLGIDNTPGAQAEKNLTTLVGELLDPVRELWGKPLRVTSGYRCADLNRAVGGAKTSHHLRGMAADITTGNNVENRRLFGLITGSGLPFTQLIGERGFQWLHISLDPANIKRQAFTQ